MESVCIICVVDRVKELVDTKLVSGTIGSMGTKMPTELLLKAEQMGRNAFERGTACAPALDWENFTSLGRGRKGYETIALLKAWHSGWTTANLAAPVPGLDC